MLEPTSAHLGLVLNPTKHHGYPSVGAYLRVDRLGMGLEQRHMQSLLCAQSWYATRRYRPLQRPRAGRSARAWWWYAVHSTVGQTSKANADGNIGDGGDRRWFFGHKCSRIIGLGKRRKRYIELYKAHIRREEEDLRKGKPGEHPPPKEEV